MIPRKLAPAAALTACLALVPTPGIAGDAGVQVEFVEPARFIDVARPFDEHLEEIRRHLVARATPLLAAGERLSVRITQLDMAGSHEGGGRVRVFRSVYPPRIDLSFRVAAADGAVRREGALTLTDPDFMSGTALHRLDPLRYEKALIDAWLARELAKRGT